MARQSANKKLEFEGQPVRLSKLLRAHMEEAIRAHLTAVEKLTAVLDQADGDPDLEASVSEQYGDRPQDVDREQDVGDEPESTYCETHGGISKGGYAPDDAEPSLAHTNDINQETASKTARMLGSGFALDFEDQHDGREPQCEDEGAACEDEGAEHDGREPSLGAINPDPDRSQAGWANHGEDDHYIESRDEVMP